MITYTVWYKRKWFWHKIKRVKGDWWIQNFNYLGIALEDETFIEIPILGTIFKFSKERFYSTKEKMSNEAKQDIRIAPK